MDILIACILFINRHTYIGDACIKFFLAILCKKVLQPEPWVESEGRHDELLGMQGW